MISSNGVKYSDEKTMNMIKPYDGEYPRIVQIFGSDEETMVFAAKKIEKYADILDINIGCPMPKIAGNGAGAGMLKDLKNLEKILKAISLSIDIPLAIKTRIGYDGNITIFDVLKIAEKTNVQAITIHR